MRFFILAMGLALASPAYAEVVHLECVYRAVPSLSTSPERSHHITIEYQDDEISNISSPLPICETSQIEYTVTNELIIWTCTDVLDHGTHEWTGYLSRFISQYELKSVYLASDSEEPRMWNGMGTCSIVDRLF
jgi:hypothetical protein